MELQKDMIANALYEETHRANIDFDQGTIEIYVHPANSFAILSIWMLYDINNQVTNVVFFKSIRDYLKSYFKYNASLRIANKLVLEVKGGKVINITPSWDESIVDQFYNNLPASKRRNHIGWYDKD
ncbi:hypothetical protein [Cytophaga hutchinsonii]|uniref:Uncharacterized protein n=1 Tax=Cytophaga hutchinsonii (strain ATCC 33406 / DSM 1761 / CIP 103989 / NBRC 15051 / NCIMB 9469 / D465) TaxID=269798 RepID=A0A6N4SWH3_CYTH3|nr:hypothetical protein [Cytophaga hutchinsonii]ABG60679.1 hypothetical protein CHU_3445 [Cytophaga hutchinsonii ATCC 33406]SFX69387.1 hypothetical protein SAMN04487930_1084 [Cytophaga hutchinsonii ATCC 33406]